MVVGKDRNDPICGTADDYLRRIKRTLPVELIELKEAPLKRSASPEQVMATEAERIERAIGPNDRVVALDRAGVALTSEDISSRLDRAMQSGCSALTLIVGGPSGLHRSILERADERWSLSALTLPHRIARLVIAEQVYRACTILRGEPYHK